MQVEVQQRYGWSHCSCGHDLHLVQPGSLQPTRGVRAFRCSFTQTREIGRGLSSSSSWWIMSVRGVEDRVIESGCRRTSARKRARRVDFYRRYPARP